MCAFVWSSCSSRRRRARGTVWWAGLAGTLLRRLILRIWFPRLCTRLFRVCSVSCLSGRRPSLGCFVLNGFCVMFLGSEFLFPALSALRIDFRSIINKLLVFYVILLPIISIDFVVALLLAFHYSSCQIEFLGYFSPLSQPLYR